MNIYRLQIYYYNAKKEEIEVEAESSVKALLTFLQSTAELEGKNIDTIKENRVA